MIKPVNSFSPAFGSIWKNGDINFSQLQSGIIDDAVSQMQTPDKKGKTFEEKHKKWDFYFDGEKNNRVSLTAYHRSKTDKTTGEVFSDFRKVVGIYGNDKNFSITDIKKVIMEYIGSNIVFALGTLLVLSMALGNYIVQRSGNNIKPQTEAMKDSVDVQKPDSVKINSFI